MKEQQCQNCETLRAELAEVRQKLSECNDTIRTQLAAAQKEAEQLEARIEQIRSTAPHGWKCFHCGESFANPNLAEAHFGGAKAVCVMAKDRELVYLLREAEERAEKAEQCFRATEEKLGVIASDLHTRFKGAKTTEDAFHLFDSMEGRALAAEKQCDTLREALEKIAKAPKLHLHNPILPVTVPEMAQMADAAHLSVHR